jgi:hypothetical protein
MKVITFTTELIDRLMVGAKTMTRRRRPLSKNGNVINRYKPGDICMVKANRFKPETYGYIRIIDVYAQPLTAISEHEAIMEGFNNRTEFLTMWKRLHGHYSGAIPIVTVILFAYYSTLEEVPK